MQAQANDSKRVLVVDDNADAAESLAMLFELHGYVVRVACDGICALREVEDFCPDLVVMDLDMPRLGGLAAAQALRERGTGSVLVALTACYVDEHQAATANATFDYCLLKPMDVGLLLRVAGQLAEPRGRP